MSRRDKNDLEWQKVKAEVSLRDKNVCRLMRVLTPQEAYLLINKAGSLLNRLTPAHVFPVSTDPRLCYCADNIMTLNQYSHSLLEECKHPLTGEKISKEDEKNWWIRILGNNAFTKLERMR